jgi:uncharacterized protein (TIGR02246 family)
MKVIALVIVNLLICSAVYSQTANDEQQVRAVIQNEEDAWNKHDFTVVQNTALTPDAVLINPIGEYWKSKAVIVDGIKKVSDIMLKYTTSKYTIRDIRFLGPSAALAVVHNLGRVEQDFNNPDGSIGGVKGQEDQSMISYILVKANNTWKITFTQITPIMQQGVGMTTNSSKGAL